LNPGPELSAAPEVSEGVRRRKVDTEPLRSCSGSSRRARGRARRGGCCARVRPSAAIVSLADAPERHSGRQAQGEAVAHDSSRPPGTAIAGPRAAWLHARGRMSCGSPTSPICAAG